MSKYKLSETELEFMNYFWSISKEHCKKDILNTFLGNEKRGSTISFYLSKLAKKGFLIARREGKNFFYKPAISKLEYEQNIINEKLNKTYGQTLETILANFCGRNSLTDDDIVNIQNWLKQLELELKEDK